MKMVPWDSDKTSSIFFDSFYLFSDGFIIGDKTDVKLNGLKNLNLVDCVIPKSFRGNKVYGLGYRCFHSAHSFIRAFVPNTITKFENDVFANCTNLQELYFEDGFKNVNLGGYTLFRTTMRSFNFPIGSSVQVYFFQLSQIEFIYIYDFMKFDETNIFWSCPQTIHIYVPLNYPYDSFGGRPVTKILPDYFFHADTDKFKNQCFSNHLSNVILFLFLLS